MKKSSKKSTALFLAAALVMSTLPAPAQTFTEAELKIMTANAVDEGASAAVTTTRPAVITTTTNRPVTTTTITKPNDRSATSGTCGNGLTYKIDSDGKLTISGSGECLYEKAFKDRTDIKSVYIADSVTHAGYWTFMNCTNLESVNLPSGLNFIGPCAFENCTSLKSLTIPNEVTSIYPRAFAGCTGLESITLSNSLDAIQGHLFVNCKSLKSVDIPVSVNSIEDHAFDGCTSLESVTILNPNCSINDEDNTISETATIKGYKGSTAEKYAKKFGRTFVALEGEPSVAITTAPAITTTTTTTTTRPVTTTTTTGYLYPTTTTTYLPGSEPAYEPAYATVTSTTSIYNDRAPEVVTMPVKMPKGAKVSLEFNVIPSIKSDDLYIGGCFSYNDGDKPVNIEWSGSLGTKTIDITDVPENVTSGELKILYSNVWDGTRYNYIRSEIDPDYKVLLLTDDSGKCGENLTWTIDTKGTLTVSGKGDMSDYYYDYSSKSTNAPWGNYVKAIKKVVIKEGVTSIGKCAFRNGEHIESVTIPNTVKIIKTKAFYDCVKLSSVKLPESVESIDSEAFYYCRDLKSVEILNPDCIMAPHSIETNYSGSEYTMYGFKNSTAEEYAISNHHNFIAFEKGVTTTAGEDYWRTTTTTTTATTTSTTYVLTTSVHGNQSTKASTTTNASTTTSTTPASTNAPVKASLYGDANCDGKVSIADAVAVLQHIANKDKFGLTTQGQANADVDGVAGITGNDALVIQKVDAGLYKASDLPLKA